MIFERFCELMFLGNTLRFLNSLLAEGSAATGNSNGASQDRYHNIFLFEYHTRDLIESIETRTVLTIY
jgi:hypothetical protein